MQTRTRTVAMVTKSMNPSSNFVTARKEEEREEAEEDMFVLYVPGICDVRVSQEGGIKSFSFGLVGFRREMVVMEEEVERKEEKEDKDNDWAFIFKVVN